MSTTVTNVNKNYSNITNTIAKILVMQHQYRYKVLSTDIAQDKHKINTLAADRAEFILEYYMPHIVYVLSVVEQ